MSARGDVRQVARCLKRCAARARAEGFVILSEAFEGQSTSGKDGGCVLWAYNEFCNGEPLVLPDGDALSEAWDSIEHGFDAVPKNQARTGTGQRVQRKWWTVGYRLRRVLRPVKASRRVTP